MPESTLNQTSPESKSLIQHNQTVLKTGPNNDGPGKGRPRGKKTRPNKQSGKDAEKGSGGKLIPPGRKKGGGRRKSPGLRPRSSPNLRPRPSPNGGRPRSSPNGGRPRPSPGGRPRPTPGYNGYKGNGKRGGEPFQVGSYPKSSRMDDVLPPGMTNRVRGPGTGVPNPGVGVQMNGKTDIAGMVYSINWLLSQRDHPGLKVCPVELPEELDLKLLPPAERERTYPYNKPPRAENGRGTTPEWDLEGGDEFDKDFNFKIIDPSDKKHWEMYGTVTSNPDSIRPGELPPTVPKSPPQQQVLPNKAQASVDTKPKIDDSLNFETEVTTDAIMKAFRLEMDRKDNSGGQQQQKSGGGMNGGQNNKMSQYGGRRPSVQRTDPSTLAYVSRTMTQGMRQLLVHMGYKIVPSPNSRLQHSEKYSPNQIARMKWELEQIELYQRAIVDASMSSMLNEKRKEAIELKKRSALMKHRAGNEMAAPMRS